MWTVLAFNSVRGEIVARQQLFTELDVCRKAAADKQHQYEQGRGAANKVLLGDKVHNTMLLSSSLSQILPLAESISLFWVFFKLQYGLNVAYFPTLSPPAAPSPFSVPHNIPAWNKTGVESGAGNWKEESCCVAETTLPAAAFSVHGAPARDDFLQMHVGPFSNNPDGPSGGHSAQARGAVLSCGAASGHYEATWSRLLGKTSQDMSWWQYGVHSWHPA